MASQAARILAEATARKTRAIEGESARSSERINRSLAGALTSIGVNIEKIERARRKDNERNEVASAKEAFAAAVATGRPEDFLGADLGLETSAGRDAAAGLSLQVQGLVERREDRANTEEDRSFRRDLATRDQEIQEETLDLRRQDRDRRIEQEDSQRPLTDRLLRLRVKKAKQDLEERGTLAVEAEIQSLRKQSLQADLDRKHVSSKLSAEERASRSALGDAIAAVESTARASGLSRQDTLERLMQFQTFSFQRSDSELPASARNRVLNELREEVKRADLNDIKDDEARARAVQLAEGRHQGLIVERAQGMVVPAVIQAVRTSILEGVDAQLPMVFSSDTERQVFMKKAYEEKIIDRIGRWREDGTIASDEDMRLYEVVALDALQNATPRVDQDVLRDAQRLFVRTVAKAEEPTEMHLTGVKIDDAQREALWQQSFREVARQRRLAIMTGMGLAPGDRDTGGPADPIPTGALSATRSLLDEKRKVDFILGDGPAK